jgi:Cu(I)/Ag(I) efflux system membrane fusion protein
MNTKLVLGGAVAIALVAAGGYGLYSLGMSQGMSMGGGAAPAAAPAEGRKVLYWHDPMVPGHKFDKPGKSPFMDMQLVPVYADEGGDAAAVRIDPSIQQNLGIRTTEVTRVRLGEAVEVVGNVAYNERDQVVVQARAGGFLERVLVRAPLDRVAQGQPLAQLYAPDWVAAQEEFLAVRRMGERAPPGLLAAARQRMLLAGMSEAQAAAVDSKGEVQARITLASPVSGIVTELAAREGMTVSPGAMLFRINGLGTVWVNAEVPEALAAGVRPGTPAQVKVTALEGETFAGKVTALLPEVDPATRTLKARIEVANPKGSLAPGMFARVSFGAARTREVLALPSEAVIRTGKRSLVMRAAAEGRFEPVEVQTGDEAGGKVEIVKGLAPGDRVVTSGQFLVDSEASLKGVIAGMQPQAGAAPMKPAPGSKHRGEGKVEHIGKGEVTLSHGPMPTLDWPPMTMDFKLPPSGLPPGIAVGDAVTFETQAGAGEGEWAIASIAKKGAK